MINKGDKMFTIIRSVAYDENTLLIECVGKSTGSKPTNGIAVGSMAFEMDTSKFYMFDGSAWLELE